MSKRGFKNPETQAKAKKTKSELRKKQKEVKKFEQHRKNCVIYAANATK